MKDQSTTNTAGTVAIDKGYHWRPIDADTPLGVKLQLINRRYGVATYGSVFSHNSFWTHWAPLPTFATDQPRTARPASFVSTEDALTVAELKRAIQDWPEIDADGEPTEVWIGDGRGYSNAAREVWPLSQKIGVNGTYGADLLIDITNPEEPS